MTHTLFSVYGVELEYMLVDKETLNVKPAADVLLKKATGQAVSEAEFGEISWSNELALHVIEMKTNGPRPSLSGLAHLFHNNVKFMNLLLGEEGLCLMPTGAHPWMNPHKESVLWPHEQNEIYYSFNRIFDCSGHGWTNLQSAHLNLPFANDKEFAYLHSAIRLLLPIMPALSASTPIMEGKKTGYLDGRLRYYQFNQKRIPSIVGLVIPELVFSQDEYQEKILSKIYEDISPFDPEGILQDEWLNSRGAIARFQRDAIEIRILDTQECPLADIAIMDAITQTLRVLIEELDLLKQSQWTCERLRKLFDIVIHSGQKAVITDSEYLALFGMDAKECRLKELWQHIILNKLNLSDETEDVLKVILEHGSLAERIMSALDNEVHQENLHQLYGELVLCLEEQRLFRPHENYYHV